MFANPQEYLQYLKDRYNKPIPGIRDNRFDEITKKQWQEYVESAKSISKIPKEVASNEVETLKDKALDISLSLQFKGILLSQRAEERKGIERCVAIGSVDTGELNTFIAKGGVNIYCIVLNSGLMMLLHRNIKFVVASNLPQDVVYCDGQDPSQFSAHDYALMMQEMLDIYARTGFPRGALIKFRAGSKGSQAAATFLNSAESFVICHELGHLLNNDLDEESSFLELHNDSRLMKYVEGKDHAKELKADATGYRLLSNYLNKEHPKLDSNFSMMGIVIVMDALASIGIEESYSHPSPKDRVINIAKSFFPDDKVKFWMDSYSRLGL